MSTPIRAAGAFEWFSKGEIEQSISQRFESQVLRHPDRRAVATASWDLTYRELNALANQIAHSLLALRDLRNKPVALLLDQDAPLIAATLGVLKSGNLYVPLEPGHPMGILEGILAHSGADVLVSDHANLDLARRLAGSERSLLPFNETTADCTEDPGLAIPPDAPAYVYYTSGSTGTPKGVVDSHRNVLHNIMRYTNGLRIGPEDRLSLVQLPSFSGAVSSMFSALLNGAACYPFDPRGKDPEKLARWARANALTMWHSVPSLFRQLCHGGGIFQSFRVIRLEGDRATPGDVAAYKRHFSSDCVLVNGLGATETGLVRRFFIGHDTHIRNGVVPIGYPVEDMDVLVLDEGGRHCGPGQVGEIAVRSRYLAAAYWKDPGRTRRAFLASPDDPGLRLYRTGDLGRMRSDSCLEHLGRTDSRFKIQGHTIEAGAVEAALCELEEVRQAVVIPVAGRHEEPSLAAYLVVDGSETPTVSSLRRRLAERLPDHMVPSRFVLLDSFPLNGNGKVDRRGLPPLTGQRPSLDAPFAPPSTPAEKRIAAIWKRALEIEDIGIDDDFFDLGGRSVDVARVLVNLPVRLAAFVAQPTVRAIAALVDAQETSGGNLLLALRPNGAKPALICVPGHDGTVFGYRNLARSLPDSRSVVALVPPALAGIGVPFRLEDLAARYVREIRTVQPDGPYLLAGHCFGGYVAYEVACQLTEHGAEVMLLALVECERPTRATVVEKLCHLGGRLTYHTHATVCTGPVHLWKRARVVAKKMVERQQRRAFERFVRDGQPLPESLRRLDLANQAAAAAYSPGRFAGRALLLGSTVPQAVANAGALMGWDGLLVGDVETHRIPDNLEGLLSEPTVRWTARHLQTAIDASLRLN